MFSQVGQYVSLESTVRRPKIAAHLPKELKWEHALQFTTTYAQILEHFWLSYWNVILLL